MPESAQNPARAASRSDIAIRVFDDNIWLMGRIDRSASDRADERRKSAPRPAEPTPQADGTEQAFESLQRAAGNAAVSRLLQRSKLRAPSSGGEPLGPQAREGAEKQLGADMGAVRVHSDAAAATYTASLGASAATIGKDIYLASDARDATTSRGSQTFLHELVHTAQSSNSGATPTSVSRHNDPSEVEARQLGEAVIGGRESRPIQTAASGVVHLRSATDEEDQTETPAEDPASPKVTAQELLNPTVDEAATDQSPKPGTSGDAESVVYEITIMQPLRDALLKVQSQDWDEAKAAIQSIGFRLLDYQNTYEKRDPLLYAQLMSARGWLSLVLQHINQRLGAAEWTDDQITEHVVDSVTEFQRLGGLIH